MNAVESRSIRTAAATLLVISCLRWGAAALSDRAGARARLSGPELLTELTAATAAATEEGERRSSPLGTGEPIDPNRAGEAELDRLPGVGPATALAIVAARDSGIVFRRATDLTWVRGIGPALASRLAEHLDLADPPVGPDGLERVRAPDRRSAERIDVNRAGVAELQRLPGIGPALAERILATRRASPFRDVDDLTRVPGIGPATIERLRGRVTVAGGP